MSPAPKKKDEKEVPLREEEWDRPDESEGEGDPILDAPIEPEPDRSPGEPPQPPRTPDHD